MISFFETKTDAVGFASDLNQTFGQGSASITITPQGKYAVCYAPIATGELSEGIDENLAVLSFFSAQVNT
jgi:hypothetical protein